MADEVKQPKDEAIDGAANDKDSDDEKESEDIDGELVPKKYLRNSLAKQERLHRVALKRLQKEFDAKIADVKNTAAVIAKDNPPPEDIIMDNMTAQQPPSTPIEPQITPAPGAGMQVGGLPTAVPPMAPPPLPPANAMAQAAGAPAQPPGVADPLAGLTPEQLQSLNIKLQQTQQNAQAAQQQEQMALQVQQEKQGIIQNIDTAMDNDPDFKQLFADNAAKLPPQFFASAIDLLIGEDDAPAVFKKLIGSQEGINSYINSSPVERTKLLNRLGKQVQAEKLGDMTPTAMTSFATRNTGKSAKAPEEMTAREYAAHMKSRGLY